MKYLLGVVSLIIVIAGVWLMLRPTPSVAPGPLPGTGAADPKNATYVINGQPVTLVNGRAEVPAAPGSASKVVTTYFGNDLSIDLNGDGRMDDAFILTQETGGSGVFYYAVAALNTPEGYIGSSGYLLGDRIAPQSTNASQSPNQKGVVVFNYVDRAPNEPMSAQPTVGKSVYLRLDAAMRLVPATSTNPMAGDYRCGNGTEFSLVATSSGFELLPATSVEHVPHTILTATTSEELQGGGVTVLQGQGELVLRAPGVDTTCHRYGPPAAQNR